MLTIKQAAIKAAHEQDNNKDLLLAQDDAVATFMKNKTRAYSLFLVLNGEKVFENKPVPGSESPKSNNPDKFKETVEGREVEGSYWNTYADSTVYATTVDKKRPNSGFMSVLAAIGKDVEPYGSMSDPDKAEAKKMGTQRRDANRKAINTAARIYFRRLDVLDFGHGSVNVSFKAITDKDGDTIYDEDTTTPIVVNAIGEGSDPSEFKRLSVGEFLALDMAKAEANFAAGGISRWKAVIKSGGKGKKTPPPKDKTGDAKIANVDQAIAVFAELANYVGIGGGKDTGYAKIVSYLASLKGDDRRKTFHTIYQMCLSVDGLFEIVKQEGAAVEQAMLAANATTLAKTN